MEVAEDRRKRAEERCVEIVRRKSEYEALEVKFRALECEKAAMEEQIRALKRGSGEIKDKGNRVEVNVDLDEDNTEEDGVFQLMLENKALECEKKNAESEIEAWRRRFKELETWVLSLDKNLVLKDGEEFPLKLSGDMLEASRRTEVNARIELGYSLKVGMESSRSKDAGVNVVDLTQTVI